MRRSSERASLTAGAGGLRAHQDWVEAVSQLADSARREAALDEIRAAFRAISGAPARGVQRPGTARRGQFEKQSFREPVLAIARNSTGQLRVRALYALYNTDRRPEDLSLALALADDDSPAVLESGLHLLSSSATAS